MATGQTLHFGLVYLILSFFIFGSLYNRSLLVNLGFGLFYTLSWLCCFFIPSLIYTDPDFKHVRNSWRSSSHEKFLNLISKKRKDDFIFSVLFWFFEAVFVLMGLQFLQYNLMLLNLMGIVGLLGYALTMLVSRMSRDIKDGQVDPLFRLIKICFSTYLIWYFLYLGLLIIVINFSPKTETILMQISLILPVVIALLITGYLPISRSACTAFSFILGFLMTALWIAYFSYSMQDKIINIQSIENRSTPVFIKR
ncbi:hypothetical protein Lbru_1614 [Legionella brunensis]|uniref:Transmembrane protein n=2 Tax=Legionella brunensis TaxID=29422 RepID=A0A0W0SKA0_9GAMM|nr:hypothetical protein Lbru_1614 [Legionella brunensis]